MWLFLGGTKWREKYVKYGGAKIQPDATQLRQGVTSISDAHVKGEYKRQGVTILFWTDGHQ